MTLYFLFPVGSVQLYDDWSAGGWWNWFMLRYICSLL